MIRSGADRLQRARQPLRLEQSFGESSRSAQLFLEAAAKAAALPGAAKAAGKRRNARKVSQRCRTLHRQRALKRATLKREALVAAAHCAGALAASRQNRLRGAQCKRF